MKKIILIAVVAFVFINLGKIYDFFDPPPNFSSIAEGTVVIYTTSSCGYCFKAKRLFKSMSVKYIEFDIEKSKEAHQQFTQLGGQGVPLIVIGDKRIHGYSRGTIIETLKKI
jgi:glutaredoxin